MFSHHFSRHVTLLLLAMTVVGPLIPRVQSSAPTSLGIWSNDYFSNIIVDPALTIESAFSIDIQVQGISQDGANGFDITILYDPDVIKATQASHRAPLCPTTEGCLFDSPNTFTLVQDVDSPPGTVRLSVVFLNNVATGSGILFKIVFKVTGIGTSPIDIQENISILARGGTSIPFKSTDGSFDNTGPPRPDFMLSASPMSLSLQLGLSGNATVYVSSLNGFAGDVALALAISPDSPDGIAASLGQYTITLGVDETATTILDVSSNSTQTGKYTVTVTGTSDALSHTTSVSVSATSGSGGGFSFRDDFNYNSGEEFEAAGWIINPNGPPGNYIFGGGVVTLLNDGTLGAEVIWNHIPSGVSDWSLAVRGSWVGNSVGSIYVVFTTQTEVYFWQADGFYGNFVFGYLATWWDPIFSIPGYQPQLNLLRDLRVDMMGGMFSLYFDGQLKGTYQEPNPSDLTGIRLNAAWMAHNSFDFVEVSQITSEPDFTLQANPSYLTIEAGTSGSSTVVVGSRGGFSGDVDLVATSPPDISTSISPGTVSLLPDGSTNALLTISTSNATIPGNYSIEVSGTSGVLSHSVILSLTVTRPNQLPVAVASWFPVHPFVGEYVQFDGSISYDLDGFIVSWYWEFGDGFVGYGPYTYHFYQAPGLYTVTLTVTDDRGGTGPTSIAVEVRPRPVHDVAVLSVLPTPVTFVSGQTILVQVGVANYGQVNETIDLVIYYGENIAAQVSGVTVPYGVVYGFTVPVLWTTSGVEPGDYTISATAVLATDEVIDNNSLSDGLVTVLPPPVLSLSPGSGVLGTKVIVEGSGFPLELPYPIVIPRPVIVTFDDVFLGTSFIVSGMFTFTFNLQHAEPGPHLVKAFDIATGLTVSQQFEVLPEPYGPGVLAVSVEVGAVYFPGDNVDVFVLITLDGSPISSPDQLALSLIKLDGSRLSMVPRAMSPGVYKASYTLPRNGAYGTYAVTAHVQYESLDASGIASFEVKPSWITTQSPRIATATIAIGIIATVGLAWKMGYLRRKDTSPASEF